MGSFFLLLFLLLLSSRYQLASFFLTNLPSRQANPPSLLHSPSPSLYFFIRSFLSICSFPFLFIHDSKHPTPVSHSLFFLLPLCPFMFPSFSLSFSYKQASLPSLLPFFFCPLFSLLPSFCFPLVKLSKLTILLTLPPSFRFSSFCLSIFVSFYFISCFYLRKQASIAQSSSVCFYFSVSHLFPSFY